MHKCVLFVSAVLSMTAAASAQANRVVGMDGNLVRVDSLTYYGRRGAAYPNGEVGMAMLNEMCNLGSVNIPWNAPMAPDHPKFGFLATRISGGRMVQISDWSYCKHAFLTINANGPCGTCGAGSGSSMGLHCDDTYSAGNNSTRFYLGPPEEIDPWLGTWNPVGSYFDRGDPAATGAAANDGVRSLTNAQTNAFDAVKNRVTVGESELTVAGAQYYYGIQLIHQGEPVENRGNNNCSRQFTPSWNGSSWSFANVGAQAYGSILQWWAGAADTNLAHNGQDDGRFAVGVVVTGPVNGLWHYEYAVHNIDNNRGSAALHIPVCSSAQVSNPGFRDIDSNMLNQWTMTRAGGEVVFSAPANNPLNWNQIYNFWFDSDAAPIAGAVNLDEARLGGGANAVAVVAKVPGMVPNRFLGAGCGAVPTTLRGNGIATLGNAGFAVQATAPANSGLFLFFAFGPASLNLGGGCTQWIESASLSTYGFLMTNGAGVANIPLPIPATALPMDLYLQAATLSPGGPLFSAFGLSSGLCARVAPTGCQ